RVAAAKPAGRRGPAGRGGRRGGRGRDDVLPACRPAGPARVGRTAGGLAARTGGGTGMSLATLITVIAVLAVGTYGLRLAGVVLNDRLVLSEPVARLLPLAAVALLAALAATTALTEAGSFAGIARPAGVLAGVVAAWRRLPFIAVVIIAAGTAAGLRLLGVP